MASGQAGQDAEPKKTLAEIENERITRRAALRKFGFGAGMAALMALSVDDLARMAAVKLQQNAGDSQVANAVAKEFRNAGVAFADGTATPGDDTLTPQHPVCHKTSNNAATACTQCSTTPEIPGGDTAKAWCCREVYNNCYNNCPGGPAECNSACNSQAYNPCMASVAPVVPPTPE